jgi:hypothetical protein
MCGARKSYLLMDLTIWSAHNQICKSPKRNPSPESSPLSLMFLVSLGTRNLSLRCRYTFALDRPDEGLRMIWTVFLHSSTHPASYTTYLARKRYWFLVFLMSKPFSVSFLVRVEMVDWVHLVKRMQILVLVLSYFFSLLLSLVLDRPKKHRTW